MLGKLFLLFTIVPLIELFLLIVVGNQIGAGPTIAIVLVTGALGAFFAKQQGLRVWQRVNAEMASGRFPAAHLLDGLLLLAAGVTLITPGFITDVLGFMLVFPVTRVPFRNWLKKRLEKMMLQGPTHTSFHAESRYGFRTMRPVGSADTSRDSPNDDSDPAN